MSELMRIVVNGRDVHTELVCVSYDDVLTMAGMTGSPSVTYSSQLDGDVRRQGTMYPGCSPIWLSHVMTFNVCHTGGA